MQTKIRKCHTDELKFS